MAAEGTVRSGYQLLIEQMAQRRPHLDHMNDALFVDDGGPRPKSIIEISGNSNTGKSVLLHELMVRTLLPSYYGGKYGSIIFIDLDHKFCMAHFVETIKCVIQQSDESCTEGEYDDIALKCLESAFMLHCYSAEEFELALDEVEKILLDNHTVALLVIDNLNAYYWLEAGIKMLSMASHYARYVSRLRNLCDTYNICCAYTVNSHYIDKATRQSVSASLSVMKANQVNYKFKLCLHSDGLRTLNERPITIHTSGIQFQGVLK